MTSISRSVLPLSGIRVVDFGQYIAGPAVAMILGDLGAKGQLRQRTGRCGRATRLMQ